MDKETRLNQKKVRQQKNAADKHIWAKVPPKIIKRSEMEHERRATPQRIVVKED